MTMLDAGTLRGVFAVAMGLALGSVLPADLLARWRSVDIRTSGDGNPGTINAIRVLGWIPGLITAAYDLSVGVIAIVIAGLIGADAGWTYLAGIATIVGHRFPLYTRFRGGGQGMAASAGLLLYAVAQSLSRGWLTTADILWLIAILAVSYAVSRSDIVAAVVMLPFLLLRIVMSHADWQFTAITGAIAGYIWVVQLIAARSWIASRRAHPMRGRTRG